MGAAGTRTLTADNPIWTPEHGYKDSVYNAKICRVSLVANGPTSTYNGCRRNLYILRMRGTTYLFFQLWEQDFDSACPSSDVFSRQCLRYGHMGTKTCSRIRSYYYTPCLCQPILRTMCVCQRYFSRTDQNVSCLICVHAMVWLLTYIGDICCSVRILPISFCYIQIRVPYVTRRHRTLRESRYPIDAPTDLANSSFELRRFPDFPLGDVSFPMMCSGVRHNRTTIMYLMIAYHITRLETKFGRDLDKSNQIGICYPDGNTYSILGMVRENFSMVDNGNPGQEFHLECDDLSINTDFCPIDRIKTVFCYEYICMVSNHFLPGVSFYIQDELIELRYGNRVVQPGAIQHGLRWLDAARSVHETIYSPAEQYRLQPTHLGGVSFPVNMPELRACADCIMYCIDMFGRKVSDLLCKIETYETYTFLVSVSFRSVSGRYDMCTLIDEQSVKCPLHFCNEGLIPVGITSYRTRCLSSCIVLFNHIYYGFSITSFSPINRWRGLWLRIVIRAIVFLGKSLSVCFCYIQKPSQYQDMETKSGGSIQRGNSKPNLFRGTYGDFIQHMQNATGEGFSYNGPRRMDIDMEDPMFEHLVLLDITYIRCVKCSIYDVLLSKHCTVIEPILLTLSGTCVLCVIFLFFVIEDCIVVRPSDIFRYSYSCGAVDPLIPIHERYKQM